MCEILALQSTTPFEIGKALEYGRAVEQFGIAGFGWGISWVQEGELHRYRSSLSLTQDEVGARALSGEFATSCLIHLRRPSFLSTIAIENSQPYLAGKELAFAHNGYLANHQRWREQLADVLEGQSDSEVGFHLYRQHMGTGSYNLAMEQTVRDAMGTGEANLVALHRDETLVVIGRNDRNPLYWFTSQDFDGIVTGLHSLDTFVFEKVLPWIEVHTQITDVFLAPRRKVLS